MFLDEKEIRRIIKKNILLSKLISEATAMGNYTYKRGDKKEFGGVKGYKMVARDSNGKTVPAETIFIPNSFPESGVPLKRDSNNAFTEEITDPDLIKQLSSMLSSDEETSTKDAFADAKVITPELSTLLSLDAKTLFLRVLDSAGSADKNYVAAALATMNKKFVKLNQELNRISGSETKPTGLFTLMRDAANDNILKDEGIDHAATVGVLNKKGNAEGQMGDIGVAKSVVGMTATQSNFGAISDVINDYINKKASIFAFAELSLTYSRIGEAKSTGNGSIISAFLGSNNTGGAAVPSVDFDSGLFDPAAGTPAAGALAMLANNSLLTQLPLFYVSVGGKKLPVFQKGSKGYEAVLTKLVDGLTGKTKGKTKQSQKKEDTGGEPAPTTTTTTTTKKTKASDPNKVGGINMIVEVDGSPEIKNLDDLGYKSGTDVALKQTLRRLVKSERKFKGTGKVNLEVIFNKNGTVTKVSFRKGFRGGQSRSALRQTERVRARIKEYLNNASFEDFKVSDPNDPTDTTTFNQPVSKQWFLASGIKDKLVELNRGRYKFNLVLEMF
jgi:hypothetical protein